MTADCAILESEIKKTEIDMTMEIALETLKNDIVADYESWQTLSGKPRTEIQARMLDEFINGIRIDEGSKYTKVVARRMIQMTQSVIRNFAKATF